MSTVTLTAVGSATLTARLQVAVADAAPGETMTITRVDGSRVLPVMGATEIAAVDRVIVDAEIPLNRAVSWQVRTSTGAQATSGPVTVTAALAAVSDPVNGRQALVVVVDRDTVSRDPRATVLEVEGDAALWIVRDVPAGRRAPIVLYSLTRDAAGTLDAMLAAGGPLLLRCGCGYHDDLWIEPVTTTTGARLVKAARVESRLWDLGACVLHPGNPWPAGTTARGNTLGALYVAVGYSTLGEIASRWATLGDIAIADLGV